MRHQGVETSVPLVFFGVLVYEIAMRRAIVIQPPLLLSRDFIDYPWFDGLGAYQAAAVLLRRGWQVEVLDGLIGSSSDLFAVARGAWLWVPKESFVERLDGIEADLVLVHASPFMTGFPGRRWLGELVSRTAGAAAGLLVLAEMFTGGVHYLDIDARALGAWFRPGRSSTATGPSTAPKLS